MKYEGFDPEFAELFQNAAPEEFARVRQQYSKNIAQLKKLSDVVQTYVRPQFEHRAYLFKEGVREERGFEVEYRRILRRVLVLYFAKAKLREEDSLSEDEQANQRQRIVEATLPVVGKVIFPMFDDLPGIGEEVYLLIYYWIIVVNVDQNIKSILESGNTPPEMVEGVFGMLALLKNAREAADVGEMPRAYSYLLDANHLIGMRDGAVYASVHLPVVTLKRRAMTGKKAQIDVYAACRKRVAQLYAEMLQKDEPSEVHHGANYYGKKIWAILDHEAKRDGTGSGLLKESGVIGECRKLAKQRKKNASLRPASAKRKLG